MAPLDVKVWIEYAGCVGHRASSKHRQHGAVPGWQSVVYFWIDWAVRLYGHRLLILPGRHPPGSSKCAPLCFCMRCSHDTTLGVVLWSAMTSLLQASAAARAPALWPPA